MSVKTIVMALVLALGAQAACAQVFFGSLSAGYQVSASSFNKDTEGAAHRSSVMTLAPSMGMHLGYGGSVLGLVGYNRDVLNPTVEIYDNGMTNLLYKEKHTLALNSLSLQLGLPLGSKTGKDGKGGKLNYPASYFHIGPTYNWGDGTVKLEGASFGQGIGYKIKPGMGGVAGFKCNVWGKKAVNMTLDFQAKYSRGQLETTSDYYALDERQSSFSSWMFMTGVSFMFRAGKKG